jgi:hypothetical protein
MILVKKPERKRPLRRPSHRLEDNIKVDLKYGMRIWTELIWLKIWSSGRLL